MSVARAMERTRYALPVTLAALDLAAWWWLWRNATQMSKPQMGAMWMPPVGTWRWEVVDFVALFTMWLVMMMAMMAPAALPFAWALVRMRDRQPELPAAWVSPWRYSAGYLLMWGGFAVAATVVQWALHAAGWLSAAMTAAPRWIAVGVLILAGAYQFSPWKDVCLRYCRSPLGILLGGNRRGAWRVGVLHGLSCVGCCGAEMLVMFVVGVMNLTVMAALTLVILVEKFAPVPLRPLRYVTGTALLLWAAVVLLR